MLSKKHGEKMRSLSEKRRRSITGNIFNFILPAIIVFIIIFFVFFLLRIAPFGGNTLAIEDSFIQYLDFFGFYKDFLNGDNSIIYSFSNYLGGSTIGVFAYYLASPVNFLIAFFDKDNMVIFYHLALAVKLSLCAGTFSVFLKGRFQGRIGLLMSCLLSVSYALMNYDLVQSRNIMWLDGVFMLPLIMLGMYKIINGKSIVWFSVPLALSMIFNWYTGGINIIFSMIWFVFELIICRKKEENWPKYTFLNIIKYIYSLIAGVLISLLLMLPVIYDLRQGRGSEFDWKNLSPLFNGNPLSLITRYSIGAESEFSAFSIYCGAFILICLILFFTTRVTKTRNKIIGAVMLFSVVIMLYWQPFFFLFSLLKRVGSYYSRYSYIAVFILVFIAAFYLADSITKKKGGVNGRSYKLYWIVFVSFCASFLILSFIGPDRKNEYAVITVLLFAVTAVLLFLVTRYKHRERLKKTAQVLLVCTVLFDMTLNSYILYKSDMWQAADYIRSYDSHVVKQLAEIEKDGGSLSGYRINRTSVRNSQRLRKETDLIEGKFYQANYDEAFMFNYHGISGYTSCPDNDQLGFISALGYSISSNCITVINDTLLPADSLLGARYISTFYPLGGSKEIAHDDDTGFLYKNEYAFPLAFKVKDHEIIKTEQPDSSGAFEYQSFILGSLTGVDEGLYDEVSFTEEKEKESVSYELDNVDKDDIIYGYIPQGDNKSGSVMIGHDYSIRYFWWLSPKIFRVIPEINAAGNAVVKADAADTATLGKAAFVKLRKEVLREMSDSANKEKADNIEMESSSFSCNADAGDNEYLFLSVPYSKGMNVSVNGKTVKPELVGGCLMIVPLENGHNDISVRYVLPYQKEGIICAVAGGAMIFVYLLCKYKIKKRNN